jgi:hypothetical protein
MTAPENIKTQVRAYLTECVLPVLPAEVRAVSFEITAWLVTVHLYQEEVFSDHGDRDVEHRIEQLASVLPPREGEDWQSVWSFHRRSPARPQSQDEEVVYAV